jgi:phospholipid/cholesterol/gamma-HCH transport system substrate-binding protein
MKGNILEAIIGIVVLVIAIFFVFFAYTTSGEKISSGSAFVACFDNVSGLAIGADIKINGIKVGIVKDLKINEGYRAEATLLLKNGINLPEDTTAAVVTDGIMGNKFISLIIGFSDKMLTNGQEIESTKSSINLEDLIDKFIIGALSKGT